MIGGKGKTTGIAVNLAVVSANAPSERALVRLLRAWGFEARAGKEAIETATAVVVDARGGLGAALRRVERDTRSLAARPAIVAVRARVEEVTPVELARCDDVLFGPLRRREFAARLFAALRRAEFEGKRRPFRALVEALPLGVFATNREAECEFTNPAYERITGLSPGEARGAGWVQAFHPDDRDRLFDDWTVAALDNRPYEGVVRLLRTSGELAWVRIRTGLVRDGGRTLGHVGVLEDITAQREAEFRLQEAHTLLDVIQRASLDAIFVVGPNREVLFYNERVLEFWGIGDEEELRDFRKRTAIIEEQLREPSTFRRFVEQAYGDPGFTGRVDLSLRDGRHVELYTAPAVTPDGRWLGRVWYWRDITERRRAEEERDRYFRHSLDLLAVTDYEARFVRVNPAWTRVLGWEEEELVGRCVTEFVHPEDLELTREAIARAQKGEELRDVRARYRTKDGGYRWLSWNTAPSARGVAYSVVRDVTDLVQAQERQEELLAVLEARMRDLEEQARALDELRAQAEYAATHDALTGALSRRAWFQAAVEERPTALALFDIDHFKRINDTYGHPAGDAVLVEVVRRLGETLGDDTLLGRLGGEEFGALFRCPPAEAKARAERAVQQVRAAPVVVDRRTSIPVTISAGIAPWLPTGESREASLAKTYEAADKALYRAKRAGRDRLVTTPAWRHAA